MRGRIDIGAREIDSRTSLVCQQGKFYILNSQQYNKLYNVELSVNF